MKIDEKSQAALQEPDTKAVVFEITPERKEHFRSVCNAVLQLLQSRTEGPLEAYAVLVFVGKSFEDTYGIRGGFSIGKDDLDH